MSDAPETPEDFLRRIARERPRLVAKADKTGDWSAVMALASPATNKMAAVEYLEWLMDQLPPPSSPEFERALRQRIQPN